MVRPSLNLFESAATTTSSGTELHKPIRFSTVSILTNLEFPAFLLFYFMLCVVRHEKKTNTEPVSFSLFLIMHKVRAGGFGNQCVSFPSGAHGRNSGSFPMPLALPPACLVSNCAGLTENGLNHNTSQAGSAAPLPQARARSQPLGSFSQFPFFALPQP